MKSKIGILGSGAVAQTLGSGFLKHGFDVMLGTRDLSKLEEWKSGAGAKAKIGSFSDAAGFGDILVLSVSGLAAEEVLKTSGLNNFDGKTIIDTTNPIAAEPPVHGVVKYFTGLDESLMERLQKIAFHGNFVKAFSSVGSSMMVNPSFSEGKPSMFICGNNDASKVEVSAILDIFGWEVADMGKAEAARAIEPLAMLWCIPGFLNNEWAHAFKLLKQK
ncbi:MAG: NAD(P)-binding domain-containing protein [Bacteroidota bacterium]